MRLPVRVSRVLVRAAKKPMRAALSSSASSVLDRPVRHASFSDLAGHDHLLLVTYRRDGSPVPTPVWFARDQDRVYVWTEINAVKAKRLRRDPRALLAPCGPTGVPIADPIAASGRVLEDPLERARAAAAIRRQWSWPKRLFELASRPLTDVHYLEFTPAAI